MMDMNTAVKVSITPVQLHTVNIIPIKIPVKVNKQILKWETNNINNANFKCIAKEILGKKNKAISTLLDFKIY